MTEIRDVTLGDRVFRVPPLPLRHNRVVYPLCRDLSAEDGDFIARLVSAKGTPEAVLDEEWKKLETIAMHIAMAADTTLTQDDFDNLPIAHVQLLDAFFVARLQTQAWRAQEGDGTESGPGEA